MKFRRGFAAFVPLVCFSRAKFTGNCRDGKSNTEPKKGMASVLFDRRTALRLAVATLLPSLVPGAIVSANASEAPTSSSGLSETYKRVFADVMANQKAYETLIAERKKKLFSMIKKNDTVLDIGIGGGPNIPYMPEGVHMVGIDPNPYMLPHAEEKAETYGTDLQAQTGAAENIPLPDNSCDVVITTLTLCSVEDPDKAVQEILRVLKPGGVHIFIEHVIASPDRPILRGAQTFLTPLQEFVADGCHLNRDTAKILKSAKSPGYSKIQYDAFDMYIGNAFVDAINPVKPTIAGFAQKENL